MRVRDSRRRSIILALALYLPAAVLQEAAAARSDWGRDNPGGAGTAAPGGSADDNARFAFGAQTLIRESGEARASSRCGCDSTDRANGHAGRAGF
jgi:hypothetical protein